MPEKINLDKLNPEKQNYNKNIKEKEQRIMNYYKRNSRDKEVVKVEKPRKRTKKQLPIPKIDTSDNLENNKTSAMNIKLTKTSRPPPPDNQKKIVIMDD